MAAPRRPKLTAEEALNAALDATEGAFHVIVDGGGSGLGTARLAADNLALPTAPDVLATLMAHDGTTQDLVRIGQRAMALSLAVVLASDHSSIPTYRTTGVATSGGWGNHFRIATGDNNATSVKATPGQVGGIWFNNVAASKRYLKLYNKATAPAPATDSALLVAGFILRENSDGWITLGEGLDAFSSGIAFAITGGAGATDNTSITAADVWLNVLFY